VAHVGHELVLVLAGDLEVFDSFGKFTRPRLHFLEQSSVLDGDHGLIREGVDEFDLAFGEWPYFGAPG